MFGDLEYKQKQFKKIYFLVTGYYGPSQILAKSPQSKRGESNCLQFTLHCSIDYSIHYIAYTTACTVLVNTLLLGLIAKTGKS